MTSGLVLAWLVVAHLVADFVLQTDSIALGKVGSGSRVRAFVLHALAVAICMLPFVAAFGLPAVWALLTVVVAHLVIDFGKASTTLRARSRAAALAREAHEPAANSAMLGRGWTPVPAVLFLVDQVAHVAVITAAWWLWLRDATPLAWLVDAVNRIAGSGSPELHRFSVLVAVGIALVVVNVRAAALFVALLLRPERAVVPEPEIPHASAGSAAPQPPAWQFRLGPLTGRAAPEPPPPPAPRLASPGRIGEAVGVLERLLIVALILGAAEQAIGLVIAAKTLARFKQLEDREFAEYYLLGTLASVTIGVASAFAARAALGVL